MKDLFAVACSSFCVLHCALTPLLFLLGLAKFNQEWVHVALLVPIIILAGWSFPVSFKVHFNLTPMYMGAMGILCLTAALLFEGAVELIMTLFGALLCAIAHLINHKALKEHCQSKLEHDMALCK